MARTHAFLKVEKRHAFRQRWRWPLIGASFLLIISVAAVSVFRANARANEIIAASAMLRADAEAKRAAMQEQMTKLADGQNSAQSGALSMVGDLKSKLAEVLASRDELGNLITALLEEAKVAPEKLPESTRNKLKELGFGPSRSQGSAKLP